jgi:hypothetical protein
MSASAEKFEADTEMTGTGRKKEGIVGINCMRWLPLVLDLLPSLRCLSQDDAEDGTHPGSSEPHG